VGSPVEAASRIRTTRPSLERSQPIDRHDRPEQESKWLKADRQTGQGNRIIEIAPQAWTITLQDPLVENGPETIHQSPRGVIDRNLMTRALGAALPRRLRSV
jgi:hypothetical protein